LGVTFTWVSLQPNVGVCIYHVNKGFISGALPWLLSTKPPNEGTMQQQQPHKNNSKNKIKPRENHEKSSQHFFDGLLINQRNL